MENEVSDNASGSVRPAAPIGGATRVITNYYLGGLGNFIVEPVVIYNYIN